MRSAYRIMERVETAKFMESVQSPGDRRYVCIILAGQKSIRCFSRRIKRPGVKLNGRDAWKKDNPLIMGFLDWSGKAVFAVRRA